MPWNGNAQLNITVAPLNPIHRVGMTEFSAVPAYIPQNVSAEGENLQGLQTNLLSSAFTVRQCVRMLVE